MIFDALDYPEIYQESFKQTGIHISKNMFELGII